MPQYRVYERQVRMVEYVVNADDEASARAHVEMLGADEYDNPGKVEDARVIYVEEVPNG